MLPAEEQIDIECSDTFYSVVGRSVKTRKTTSVGVRRQVEMNWAIRQCRGIIDGVGRAPWQADIARWLIRVLH